MEELQFRSFMIGLFAAIPFVQLVEKNHARLVEVLPLIIAIFNSAQVNHIVRETENDFAANSWQENILITATFGAFLGLLFEFGQRNSKEQNTHYINQMIIFAIFFYLVLNPINQLFKIY